MTEKSEVIEFVEVSHYIECDKCGESRMRAEYRVFDEENVKKILEMAEKEAEP